MRFHNQPWSACVDQVWKLFAIILRLTATVQYHNKQGRTDDIRRELFSRSSSSLICRLGKNEQTLGVEDSSLAIAILKKKETDNPRSKVVRQKRQPYSTSSSISFSDFNKSKFLDDEFFEQQRTLGTLNYILVKQHRCLPCH